MRHLLALLCALHGCSAAAAAAAGAAEETTTTMGDVFVVLMTEADRASGDSGFATLEDNYCLDPVLPREQSSCGIRVLAPRHSVYSESRISDMTLDFQHPSRPNTACHVRWPADGDATTWCQRSHSARADEGPLPAYREENATAAVGSLSYNHLLRSEEKCYCAVDGIGYYKDGLDGFPEQRPSVVILTSTQGCVAAVVSGRRVNNYRTTEAPCTYNRRRKCRPLTKEQYDSMIRDIEASEIYADFRTTSNRPHLRP